MHVWLFCDHDPTRGVWGLRRAHVLDAISMTEPWGTLVACGVKAWETRSWRPSRAAENQWLAIHTARRFPPEARALCLRDPWRKALTLTGKSSADELPLGYIVGVAFLKKAEPTIQVISRIEEQECLLGNYEPGRWAWPFSNPICFPEAIVC